MRKKTSLLEDSLMQMLISAITETLAKLANLKTAGFYQEALHEIDQDLEELLGLKADLVRRLSDQHIIEMLTVNEVLDIGRLHFVAELFREEGEIQKLQDKTEEGNASQIRALNLFLEVAFASSSQIPGIPGRIESLFDDLRDSLPEDSLFTLFDYFEKLSAYRKAESALDQMLVVTHQNPDVLLEKIEFYRRLLKKSDQDLENGGLSRLEIETNIINL